MITTKSLYTQVIEVIAQKTARISSATSRSVAAASKSDVGSLVNTATTADVVSAMTSILASVIEPRIITGLSVVETSPPSASVTVETGSGTAGGLYYTLDEAITLSVPFDGVEVYYVNLYSNGIKMESSQTVKGLTLAKIIIPSDYSQAVYNDQQGTNPYIQSFKKYNLYGTNDRFEEDTVELLRDNIGQILAENLIGNIRLSENLKVTNTSGSLEVDSSGIKLYDTAGNVLAKFNNRGTFFYNENGIEIGKFATDGARVGNILITPSSLQSGNFVSGPMGAGFRITDSGEAEFNNVNIRGSLSSSVFKEDTVSTIGGSLLVLSGDVLDTDMTHLDNCAVSISGATVFAVNDILRIKDGVNEEWFKVTDISSAPVYTVERDKSAAYGTDLNPAWPAGTTIVNYGASGKGGVFMTSSDTNSPYLSIFGHAGSPWSALTTHLRMGNLNGFLGYASDTYGMAIGTTNSYLKYDPVNGLQIKGSITITGGNASVTYYQDNPPGGSGDLNVPKDGDYWVDTNDNNSLYVYNTGAWAQVSSGTAGGVTTFRQSATPTSVSIGDMWLKTDSGRLYRAAMVGADEIATGEWEDAQTTLGTTPSIGAGLYLGADYMGYYSGSAWKSYIKNDGKFHFDGDGNNYLDWNGSILTIRGALTADDMTVGTLEGISLVGNTITGNDITGNDIIGNTIKTAATYPRVEMSGDSLKIYDAGGNLVVILGDVTT